MMEFKKAGGLWLLFLLAYCSALICFALFSIQLIVSLVFYFYDGQFIFIWQRALSVAFEKGVIAGSILGLGIWIKGKLAEREQNRSNTK